MIRAYKYRLYPTNEQIKCLEKTFNLCRFLYNCALQERIFYYKHYGKGISCYDQQKALPEIKELLPEFKAIYAQVLQSTLKRVDAAYQGFFRRVKSGETVGFPRFKGKDRFHSILYSQSGFALGKPKGLKKNKRCHLKLSKVGDIKMEYHRKSKVPLRLAR